MLLGILLLLTGLAISAVAIYYSVLGLAAIFAATVPVYIMGASLEVAKLVGASWLKANWARAPGFIKYYMSIAVVVLMIITSMGIFGFLSKSHSDQGLTSGDVLSKIAIYDDKIKTEQENIDANRKAIKQMDEAVDQVMGRSTTETGADKAVAVRKSQQKERVRLQSEIAASQKAIVSLKEARAPIAAEVRKVEAEVGPIKYIAQFIYGQAADQNLLEKAVTWVIVLIVVVFDPLAVIMLLAAQQTFAWYKEDKEQPNAVTDTSNDIVDNNDKDVESGDDRHNTTLEDAAKQYTDEVTPYDEAEIKEIPDFIGDEFSEEVKEVVINKETHPYLYKGEFWKTPEGWEDIGPLVYKPEPQEEVPEPVAIRQMLDEVFDFKPEEPVNVTADTTEVTVNEPTYQILPELQEEVSKKKIHDQTARTTDSKDTEIAYVQNGEQSENSLWNRVRARVSEEFKPKDFLIVVYAKGQFEDFQYDPEVDTELDKFIKDIKNNNHSFGDYTQEQLNLFASRIYELRKN